MRVEPTATLVKSLLSSADMISFQVNIFFRLLPGSVVLFSVSQGRKVQIGAFQVHWRRGRRVRTSVRQRWRRFTSGGKNKDEATPDRPSPRSRAHPGLGSLLPAPPTIPLNRTKKPAATYEPGRDSPAWGCFCRGWDLWCAKFSLVVWSVWTFGYQPSLLSGNKDDPGLGMLGG